MMYGLTSNIHGPSETNYPSWANNYNAPPRKCKIFHGCIYIMYVHCMCTA